MEGIYIIKSAGQREGARGGLREGGCGLGRVSAKRLKALSGLPFVTSMKFGSFSNTTFAVTRLVYLSFERVIPRPPMSKVRTELPVFVAAPRRGRDGQAVLRLAVGGTARAH